MLDGTVVNLALPRIGEDLDAGFSQLQWIVNAYTLSLAALILLGGSLGDRMGRRRIFVIGAAWFTVASVLCAVAPTSEVLIGARALQGVGGALLTPGSLAIIQASFVVGRPPAGDRGVVRPRRRRCRDRPVPRRLARRRGDVAIDLPHQRAPRHRRGDDRVPPRPREPRRVQLGPARRARRRARRRRPRRHHLRPDGAGVADLRDRGGRRRRLRPVRAAQPGADGADEHLPLGPVQCHQRGDVPALRRLRRRPVPPRPRPAGPARLLPAASREPPPCR